MGKKLLTPTSPTHLHLNALETESSSGKWQWLTPSTDTFKNNAPFDSDSDSDRKPSMGANRMAFDRRRLSLPVTFPTNSDMLRRKPPAPVIRRALFLTAVILCVFFLFRNSESLRYLQSFSYSSSVAFPYVFPSSSAVDDFSSVGKEVTLEKVLKDASMIDNTVILTTLNEAWAAPNSIIDLFLESFRIGNGTLKLLNHLVIIALDEKAFRRCVEVHKYCFLLVSEGVDFQQEAYFMTPDYLKMMWRRIDFLCSILEMGYNFIFTDADIMWFRNPFPRFYLDADFQIACDHFFGSSYDIHNKPNGGFSYVKSNNRTIDFYKFWYSSRETYPGYHDQDVLNMIKFDPYVTSIGLKIRFLDTAYFGGLCEPSRDLNKVCTMHANCCFGLSSKLHDLRIMLQDWKLFVSLPLSWKRSPYISWRVPENCSLDSLQRYDSPVEVSHVLHD